MPFGRRRNDIRPVVSDKHEVTWSNLAQDASTTISILLAEAVPPNVKNAASEVGIGSKVNGFYIEFQFSAQTITNTKIIHWDVIQKRIGQPVIAPSLYYQTDRSQIFKRGMEMLPKSVNTIIKRIIFVPIPRGASRMKENNQFFFQYIATSAETINACGFAIYKEYQ